MDRATKNVSIAIIVILILVISGISYSRLPKKVSPIATSTPTFTASTTAADLNISAYLKGKSNLDSIIVAKLSEEKNTAKAFEYKPVSPTIYTTGSIKITYVQTSAALKNYGLAVAKALSPLSANNDSEIALMLRALEGKNPSLVIKLQQSAEDRKTIVMNLSKISVPQKATKAHIDLMNAISKSSALISDMALILDNPSQALQSADLLRVHKITLLKAIDNMNSFFQDNGIIFTPEEGSRLNIN